ncbi:3'-5' exonuclease ['Camptotheca acuminata' phytoplasma]|uniref:3'-5' exonuclease n=1 Tax='Camptotheca acuminata' phytoplasma TaxID=3239192 RepID=UPI00351A57C5
MLKLFQFDYQYKRTHLNINYRSNTRILEASNVLLQDSYKQKTYKKTVGRFSYTISDTEEQYFNFVFHQINLIKTYAIAEGILIPYYTIMLLFRTHSHIQKFKNFFLNNHFMIFLLRTI